MALSKIDEASWGGTQLGGRRNLIINGAMQVWQRGTSFTTDATNTYTADRFTSYEDTSALTITRSTESPAGFNYSLKTLVASTKGSTASDFSVITRILMEGQDVAPLAWGTSEGKKATLSFYFKSDVIGNYYFFVTNNAQTTVLPLSFDVNNTEWNRYTFELPAPPSGNSFNLTSTGRGIDIQFNYGGLGSNYLGTPTENVWSTSGSISDNNAWAKASAVNIMDTVGNATYITGVQLEVGDTATPFEHRSYGDELALCQRYYWRNDAEGPSDFNNLGVGVVSSSNTAFIAVNLPQKMRAQPSLSYSSLSDLRTTTVFGGGGGAPTNVVLGYNHTLRPTLYVTDPGGQTFGQSRLFGFSGTTTGWIAFDAEL